MHRALPDAVLSLPLVVPEREQGNRNRTGPELEPDRFRPEFRQTAPAQMPWQPPLHGFFPVPAVLRHLPAHGRHMPTYADIWLTRQLPGDIHNTAEGETLLRYVPHPGAFRPSLLSPFRQVPAPMPVTICRRYGALPLPLRRAGQGIPARWLFRGTPDTPMR